MNKRKTRLQFWRRGFPKVEHISKPDETDFEIHTLHFFMEYVQKFKCWREIDSLNSFLDLRSEEIMHITQKSHSKLSYKINATYLII